MVESTGEWQIRKMKEIQDLIADATVAQALLMPVITEAYNPAGGGALIEIKILISEPKLNEFRQIQKGNSGQ